MWSIKPWLISAAVFFPIYAPKSAARQPDRRDIREYAVF